MRAVVFDGNRVVVRDDVTVREPGPHEVVVRVAAAGLCHSDRKVITGDTVYPVPVVLGHEGAGIVDAVGVEVDRVGVGDRVVLHTLRSCGRCRACAAGRPTQCRGGLGAIGAPFGAGEAAIHQFANTSVLVERTVVDEQQVVPVPDELELGVAALLGCGVLTGLGAVRNRAKVAAGDTAVVLGIGGVGANVVQGARLAGASTIVAVDTNPAKQRLAHDLGATHFVDASSHDVVVTVRELVPGGVDHAFVCIGVAPLVRLAVELLGPGGQAVVVGFPPPGVDAALPVQAMYQDKSVLACRYGTSNPWRDIPEHARLAVAGVLDLGRLVSDRVTLDEVPAAFDAMAAGRTEARTVVVVAPELAGG